MHIRCLPVHEKMSIKGYDFSKVSSDSWTNYLLLLVNEHCRIQVVAHSFCAD